MRNSNQSIFPAMLLLSFSSIRMRRKQFPLSHITVWYHHPQPFFMQNPKAVRLAVKPNSFFRLLSNADNVPCPIL